MDNSYIFSCDGCALTLSLTLIIIRFSESDIEYLRKLMPRCEDGFFKWLEELDCRDVKIYAMQEGSVSSNKECIVDQSSYCCHRHCRWYFQENHC
jgi:nicotinic acid phosphoribosyltransferase